ncbi:MAG: acetyl-CoA C-acyltransferase [Kiritimatiellae bacterium]|nr:acetyl-CoA C-acyltransferase [Kiritimatiellia bacterium]
MLIVGACRTAIGELQGSLSGLSAVELGAQVIGAGLARAGLKPGDVDEVLMGNVISAGLGLCPARQAALAAGIPEPIPAFDVGMVCASGLKAVALGAASIRDGERRVVVAAGSENMSRAPHAVRGLRAGKKLGDLALEDLLLGDGLVCPIGHEHMGCTAERIAEETGITRAEQDAFALESHRRAFAARAAFAREIVPVTVREGKGHTREFSVDERMRADTSLEQLAALRPVFKPDGSVTAGNASGINDGAAALVLASTEASRALGLKPIARIVGWAAVGTDPARMGLGPVPATRRLCERIGCVPADFELVELNEAFAVQALAVMRELELDPRRVNVRGGAVALGHPLGCSGARILVTLLHAMQDRQAARGLATLCVGSGMGMAMAVELA